MGGSTVVVLGGGWGGLTAAHHLRGLLSAEHRVVVVERNDTFSFCPSYLWLMTGERETRDVSRPMAKLARPGIEWVHDEVRAFDPTTRSVTTGSGELAGDHVIIALGTENAPSEVPGFVEAAHNVYDAEGAVAARRALSDFEGGGIVVLVARTPYRCPGAPNEAAFLIDSFFRGRGIRDRVEIALYTPEKQPLGVAGPAVGAAILEMFTERGISYHAQRTVRRIDGASRTITFDEEAVPYDLLIGIPPHRAPAAIRESGLIDGTGYVPVHPQSLELLADPETLETRHAGVYAIGDVTSIRLLNSLLLPKTGVFAEGEAVVVAENVAATIQGKRASASYKGIGGCYVEVGGGMAAYGVGNFFAYPGPQLTLEPPSAEQRRAKEQFEKVLVNWFRG